MRASMAGAKRVGKAVVLCDSIYGLQAAELQQHPISLEKLYQVLVEKLQGNKSSFAHVERKEVEDDFVPGWCEYAYAEAEDGYAFLWKAKVDSSG